MAEIYNLLDPRDNSLKYIGKANDSIKRLKGHLTETRRTTPLYQWIKELRDLNLTPILKVVLIVDDWQSAEQSEISKAISVGVNLLNVAKGGNEPYCSNEVRAMNAINNTKLRTSREFKLITYNLKRQLGMLLKQGYVRESTKVKLRLAAKLKPQLFGCFATC
jgi:hypothetical protein